MILRFVLVIGLFSVSLVTAQLTVTPFQNNSNDLEDFILTELLGCEIEISNIQFIGNNESIGSFNFVENQEICENNFDLDRGLIMTTGSVSNAVGPNNNGDNSQEWNLLYEDSFLQNYLQNFGVINDGVSLFDPSVIEFDLQSSINQNLYFELIFGSEEYPEWMSPFYADAFCFFVSEVENDIDPNYDSSPVNIMETGNIINADDCDIINKPISVWTVRPYTEVFNLPSMNGCLYQYNDEGQLCDAISYDGYTRNLLFNFGLIAGAKYHIKLVIIDGAGPAIDSGIFLKKSNSNNFNFADFEWSQATYSDDGISISFTNTSPQNSNDNFFWDFNNDGTIDSNLANPTYVYSEPGSYLVSLEIINDCIGSSQTISYEVFVEANNINVVSSSLESVKFYPNPARNSLSIDLAGDNEHYLLDFFDKSGRKLDTFELNSSRNQIELSKYENGVYYVQLSNNNQFQIVERIIIMH